MGRKLYIYIFQSSGFPIEDRNTQILIWPYLHEFKCDLFLPFQNILI
jgi:hypothetical protein